MSKADKQFNDFNHSIKINPINADAYYRRGMALRYFTGNDNVDDEIADYDIAIQQKPDFAEAYFERGKARGYKALKSPILNYSHENEQNPEIVTALQMSILDFDSAIALNPEYIDAFHSRGLAKIILEEYFSAINDFNKALELKGEDDEIILRRGICYDQLGNTNEALNDIKKSMELGNEVAKNYYNQMTQGNESRKSS